MPTFAVMVARGEDGAVATVTVSSPAAKVKYHMFRMGGADPVKAVMPVAQHDFAVQLGHSYRIGVAAGNELGTGEYAYQDVLAVVAPDSPSFTLTPVYRNGKAHLAVSVSDPDPHASRYLLKVGDADAVTHTGATDLRVPVVPGEAYTVALAAGSSAGDSAFTEVTRSTTEAEYDALLEWQLILPGRASPAEAVGAATQYVAIVNGGPVRYDPVPPCVGRETALAEADLSRALALSGWVSASGEASAELVAHAASNQSSSASALEDARADAASVCASRYPTVENLIQQQARWMKVPR